MTGNITYLVDCASFQGDPDWGKVAAVCRGGAEKVTEGAGATAYVNPRWAAAKSAMLQVAKHGFVPLAYLFLDAVESGGSQADWFARNAGDLTGFGIVIDGERAPNGSTTRAQAVDAKRELNKLYPQHPIGGYLPHWFTGGEDLTFVDWLWASEYVSGSGDPALLYRQVPASWWAPYGSVTPLLLQFTDRAAVAGINGPVDCSAFHGTESQLAAKVLPAAPPPPASTSGDPDMLFELLAGQAPPSFPVWPHARLAHEPVPYQYCSLVLTGGSGAVVKVTVYGGAPQPEVLTFTMADGVDVPVIPKVGWPNATVIGLQRLDTKSAVSASAVFRTW